MQTIALHLDYSQYVCNELLIFETDQKKSGIPLIFFYFCILSHHKILVPIGLDVKVILSRHWILKSIHCVNDRTLKKPFLTYDTDNPVLEA